MERVSSCQHSSAASSPFNSTATFISSFNFIPISSSKNHSLTRPPSTSFRHSYSINNSNRHSTPLYILPLHPFNNNNNSTSNLNNDNNSSSFNVNSLLKYTAGGTLLALILLPLIGRGLALTAVTLSATTGILAFTATKSIRYKTITTNTTSIDTTPTLTDYSKESLSRRALDMNNFDAQSGYPQEVEEEQQQQEDEHLDDWPEWTPRMEFNNHDTSSETIEYNTNK
eukprot:CAMPEP_0182445432 /NCGR_PEP_ID=MMETSP1172-20130603/3556_1 /TAXON_ID=708627 /ORGANISM="Timspurckia oligopyrenoides, Strain CCMP3278" /LENGTH=226 /DNA_ID=CAMNT_0024641205 /DNA_START=46 /DNA_END=726 /DNA_ORIENTATION=-